MPRSPVSPLESHLGYWLRFVSNHVSDAFQEKVESRGVTVSEWVVLRQLFERNAVAPSQLADELGMTRGAISKLIDRLVKKSLARKEAAGAQDRRYLSVSLTVKGQSLVPRLAALADQNDEEFFSGLSDAQRETLLRLMRTVVRMQGLRELPTR